MNLPASTSFLMTDADIVFVSGLRQRAQQELHARLAALRAVHEYVSMGCPVSRACALAADALGNQPGLSRQSLNAFYTHFSGWQSLLNRTVAGKKFWNTNRATLLPDGFKEWIASEACLNQRDKFRSVWSALIQRWRRWQAGDSHAALPGYDHCPAADPLTGFPPGWSYGHLSRIKPRRYVRRLVQIGSKSASQIGPQVLTTRVGLQPGQFYVFDDCWLDFMVTARGKACRLLSFHALDLFSGCNIMRGYKPAIPDDARGTEERLKEREMVYLVAHLLGTIGYLPSGCKLICEKGTATLRIFEQQMLHDLSGGKIIVECGPAGGGPGVMGLFNGRSGGSPRWKAHLESWFNLLHNRTASMIDFPGQTGSNSRLNKPEGIEHLCNSAESLARVARTLTPERAELLRLGLLSHTDSSFAVDAIIDLINHRTDHDLEGWRKAGHYQTEYRGHPEMPWEPVNNLLAMEVARRDALAQYIVEHPACRRERALSPQEVWSAGLGKLKKLPSHAVAMLLGETPAVEIPVRRGLIEIGIPELDPDEPMRYGLQRWDGRGTLEPLRDDQTFLVRVNPLNPKLAWLYDAQGAFAGLAKEYGRVRRDDPVALRHAYGAKHAAIAPLVVEGRRLAGRLTRQATADMSHNIAVLSGRPVTPQEKADARELAHAVRIEGPEAAEAIFAPVTPAASTAGVSDTEQSQEEFLKSIL